MKTSGPSILLAALLLVPAFAWGEHEGSDPVAADEWTAAPARAEMESLELHLEDAVGRVSLPHSGILLGQASASRGYRLPGYGVVFVLTPRALPGKRPVFVVHRKGSRGGSEVHPEGHVTHTGEENQWVPERVEELERQVLVLQHAAESQRRAAEEDMDRIVEDVRVRVEVEAHGDPPVTTADVTARLDTPETPPDVVFVQRMPEPPWKFWFEGEPSEEKRTPDRVVEDVRAAVIETLETRGAGVAGLGEDDFVTVAVDFVPGDIFASHRSPSRTLIVRARRRDLAARAAGALVPEEFRDRVEVIEY